MAPTLPSNSCPKPGPGGPWLKAYPGLHGTLVDAREHDPSGDISADYFRGRPAECPVLKKGDAIIFHSLVPHESPTNSSSVDRSVLIASYAGVADSGLYRRYYDREVSRRFESYRTGLGREAFARFVASQEEFDGRLA